MFITYYWRGELIKDIRQWCKQHHTKMIKCKRIERNPPFKDIVAHEEVPELMYNNLMCTDRCRIIKED